MEILVESAPPLCVFFPYPMVVPSLTLSITARWAIMQPRTSAKWAVLGFHFFGRQWGWAGITWLRVWFERVSVGLNKGGGFVP